MQMVESVIDSQRAGTSADMSQGSAMRPIKVDIAAAEVVADDFVSGAVADPGIVRFLGMRTSGARQGYKDNLTLRAALSKVGSSSIGAGADGGGANAGGRRGTTTLRWEDIEGVLFDPYDPTEILSNPPSTVSVASSRSAAGVEEQEVIMSFLESV